MAQHDYVIDNSTGANVRADINSALLAISSNNSGSSAPSTTYALQSFANTTDSMLQLRNAANNAFVNLRKFDGSLPLPDGSVSSPSLFFDDDTNTGLFSSAADTLNFATGGTERLELGGTTVFNEDGADVDFRIEGNTEANLFYLDAGNDQIGVGTNAPDDIFHISTALNSSKGLRITNTNNSQASAIARVFISGGDNAKAALRLETNGAFHDIFERNTGELTIEDNGTERFRIDSNGQCGIGISSPATLFHVFHATTNNVGQFESGDATVSISFKDTDTTTVPTVGAAGNDLQFFTNGSRRVHINSSGRVGIGTTSQASPLHVFHSSTNAVIRAESGDEFVHIELKDSTTSSVPYIGAQGDAVRIITGGTERFRQEDSNEGTGFGGATTVTFDNMASHSGTGSEGARIRNDGAMVIGTSNNVALKLNRRSTDGSLIQFFQNGSEEGSVSVSGSTVSYNGGHLSRWSQLKGISSTDKSARPTIYQGTVLSNLDELCSWSHAEVLYDEDVLYTPEDTLPEGKSVGDVKISKGTVLREAYTEENQQLNMTKVSDTEGDKDVAGVFWTWDDDDDEYVNDFFVAMTGDMVIRVAASTTVARGDLLISAGDGTAKPQADDIIRSSTIAKIISTNHTATYADGSKAYPCVLMAC
tara:strand:+ start:43 stop:1986 length:1944 start_codon:yes stop_codon:yes gene_type:complete